MHNMAGFQMIQVISTRNWTVQLWATTATEPTVAAMVGQICFLYDLAILLHKLPINPQHESQVFSSSSSSSKQQTQPPSGKDTATCTAGNSS